MNIFSILFNMKVCCVFSFQGTEERARKSHSKRTISVRAIDVLLYMQGLNNLCIASAPQKGNIRSFQSETNIQRNVTLKVSK